LQHAAARCNALQHAATRFYLVPPRPSITALNWCTLDRSTYSFIYVPLMVNRFQKSDLLIVQYKYLKSCSEDFMLQNLIFRTRSCGTGFITEPSWLLHFNPTKMVGRKCFVPLRYQLRRGFSVGPHLEYLGMIHRVGRCVSVCCECRCL